MNGNICLPYRVQGLTRFIRAFNKKLENTPQKGKFHRLKKVSIISTPRIPTVNDSWFSGFIDAEGCFTCSFLKGTPTYRIRMLVTQKYIENLPVLRHFMVMFGVGNIESHSKKDVYSFVVSGLRNCQKVHFYFEKFPLFTKKRRYSKWCELLFHIQIKEEH